MMQQLKELTQQDVVEEKDILKVFTQRYKGDIYKILQKNITTKEKMDYIFGRLVEFYHKYEE